MVTVGHLRTLKNVMLEWLAISGRSKNDIATLDRYLSDDYIQGVYQARDALSIPRTLNNYFGLLLQYLPSEFSDIKDWCRSHGYLHEET